MSDSTHLKQSKQQATFVEWVIDILSYTIILNIFVHYVDDFYIENFMYSLVTAVLLKGMLVLIARFEHYVQAWMNKQKAPVFDYIKAPVLLGILFFSKFLILEIIDLVFGHNVDLHNLVALIAMIIVMIASRKIIYKIYRSLG